MVRGQQPVAIQLKTMASECEDSPPDGPGPGHGLNPLVTCLNAPADSVDQIVLFSLTFASAFYAEMRQARNHQWSRFGGS